jgi:hypothetical protein
MVTNL